jgi:hypothetical protein
MRTRSRTRAWQDMSCFFFVLSSSILNEIKKHNIETHAHTYKHTKKKNGLRAGVVENRIFLPLWDKHALVEKKWTRKKDKFFFGK